MINMCITRVECGLLRSAGPKRKSSARRQGMEVVVVVEPVASCCSSLRLFKKYRRTCSLPSLLYPDKHRRPSNDYLPIPGESIAPLPC
jgi:hypothetical protein